MRYMLTIMYKDGAVAHINFYDVAKLHDSLGDRLKDNERYLNVLAWSIVPVPEDQGN